MTFRRAFCCVGQGQRGVVEEDDAADDDAVASAGNANPRLFLLQHLDVACRIARRTHVPLDRFCCRRRLAAASCPASGPNWHERFPLGTEAVLQRFDRRLLLLGRLPLAASPEAMENMTTKNDMMMVIMSA